jgi:hypothetical protein
MSIYRGRVGVVSQSIDNIVPLRNKKVYTAPDASSFHPKDDVNFVQPYVVKNHTSYSKPRPTGNFQNPTHYPIGFVPLNQKPDYEPPEFNAPIMIPEKLNVSATNNIFMDTEKLRNMMTGSGDVRNYTHPYAKPSMHSERQPYVYLLNNGTY